tara:strand:+ start:122270 stop:124915 length:2646 start_codon:yes stop_codon:yes gene_type:complete
MIDDQSELISSLNDHKKGLILFKKRLHDLKKSSEKHFTDGKNIELIIKIRSEKIDKIISAAFNFHLNEFKKEVSLVAVGGYGREELHPYSDIDLLLIIPNKKNNKINKEISKLIAFLWDIGLEVGHSVRTINQNIKLAKKDQTIYTTLIENRFIEGSEILHNKLNNELFKNDLWKISKFFDEKTNEKKMRHARYDDTAYKLEPNIKESPGGLRDIHTIVWLAKKYNGGGDQHKFIKSQILNDSQYKTLLDSRSLLWKMRFGLHIIANRREDRLLFNHQIRLAELLGYKDKKHKLAIEKLMQDYYRAVMSISNIYEVAIQILEEKAFKAKKNSIKEIDNFFIIKNNYLEAKNDNIFKDDASNLLRVFLLLAKNLKIKGIGARTIILINKNTNLINKKFISNKINQNIFMDILKAPEGVTTALRKMNTYGILGLYIPAFGKIVGHMQYDLFHTYTVDAHTLFVVENLRRVSLKKYNHENLKSSLIMQSLDKPYIAYLAGIFHDIAKGRGGDHSELGSFEAEAFCLNHGLSAYDSRLVGWLVKNHLLLSVTAQKKDLNDPEVIKEFTNTVGDQIHLDYLYVLTVADVKGTNPEIWNSWKATLFWELYRLSKGMIIRGQTKSIDSEELIKEKLTKTRELISNKKLKELENIKPQNYPWSGFTEEYFLRHKPNEIAWHAEILIKNSTKNKKRILVNVNNKLVSGLTALMILAPYKTRSFVRATASLDKLGISIVDARIVLLSKKDQVLHTYFILNSKGKMISNRDDLYRISNNLIDDLQSSSYENVIINRKASRQVRVFSTPIKINLSKDLKNNRTVLELIASDQPGLLAKLGKIFFDLNIKLQNAKISTVGERAEDVFFITNSKNQALGKNICNNLELSINKTFS